MLDPKSEHSSQNRNEIIDLVPMGRFRNSSATMRGWYSLLRGRAVVKARVVAGCVWPDELCTLTN